MSLLALILIILLVCAVTGYGGTRAGLDPVWVILLVILILSLGTGGIYFGHVGW